MTNPRSKLTLAGGADKHRDRVRPWSHQEVLKAHRGHRAELIFGDGNVTGTVVEADPFTIKLRRDHDAAEVIYFKSGLAGFRPL